MRGKRVTFFATEQDFHHLIRAFEATAHCQYFEAGGFDDPAIPTYTSLLQVPTLGKVPYHSTILAPRMLLLPSEIALTVRPVPQHAGGVRYLVDQLANPYGFLMFMGGTFQPGVLVASEADTLATDAVSLALFASWAKLVKKQRRIDYAYVGPEAALLFADGWRMSTDARYPHFDLRKPE